MKACQQNGFSVKVCIFGLVSDGGKGSDSVCPRLSSGEYTETRPERAGICSVAVTACLFPESLG